MRGKLPDRPSMAVLAFDDFSGGPGTNLIGRGFAEDLITELARNPDLTIIARNTAFSVEGQRKTAVEIARQFHVRYIVEGSIQRAGAEVVLNVQLIDGADDRHVWAQRYTFGAGDVYKVQAELVAKLAGSVFSEIRATEKAASLRRPPADFDVYELTLRGLAHKQQLSREGLVTGRALLELAIARDANYAPAHIYLGHLNASDAAFSISGQLTGKDLPAAVAEIRRGIELDPQLAVGYQALGVALGFGGQFKEALEAAQRSVALGPGDADNQNFLGLAQFGVGQNTEAVASIERALELNPIPPPFYMSCYALALISVQRFDEASREATRCTDMAPGYPPCYAQGFVADLARGATADADKRIAMLMKRIPGTTTASMLPPGAFPGDPQGRERFLAPFRKAGLPD
jgi:adenylate cyclase